MNSKEKPNIQPEKQQQIDQILQEGRKLYKEQKALLEKGENSADALEIALIKEQLTTNEKVLFELKRRLEILTGVIVEETSLETAENIMGEYFLGPEAIKQTFGFEVKDIPRIPFSKEELERAKELEQQLVLYVESTPDGKPLSIMGINSILESETSEGSKLLYDTDWYKDEAFANEAPKSGWKLTSKEVIPNSISKNYLEQTVVLIEYLRKEVFRGVTLKDIPKEYLDAIEEFNDKKSTIEGLISSDWKKTTEELANLKITGLTRETPAEIMYRLALTEKTTKTRPLESTYSWSAMRGSGGSLVALGLFASKGATVSGWYPDNTNSNLGVCFSRR